MEETFEKVISDSISPNMNQLLPSSRQKTLSTNQLARILIQAETMVRAEIKIRLPDVEKRLESSVNTRLKARIKDIQVDIPGILKIQISANINIVSSVKTVMTSVYKSFASVSIAITVQSYIQNIQDRLNKRV